MSGPQPFFSASLISRRSAISSGSAAGASSAFLFILLSVPAGYEGSLTDYAALKEAGAAMIGWGAFVTAIIDFVILAFVIFLLVRAASRMMKKDDAPAGPSEVDLLTEIRDELRKRA